MVWRESSLAEVKMLTPVRLIATVAIVVLPTLGGNSARHPSRGLGDCSGLHAGIMAQMQVGSPHTSDGTPFVMFTFTVLNDGDTTASPGQNDWRLFVDDIELRDSQSIFLQGEGPIGGWRDLKPGESLQLSKGLPVAHYFPEEHENKVYWEGKGFRSSTIVVNGF